jgi:homoserine dehydrogenase
MKTLKLLLLGFGNAAQAFADLLIDKEDEIAEQFGCKVSVVGIVTKSRGCLENRQGIDLKKALGDIRATGKFDNAQEGFSQISSLEAAENLDYDVLVELTPLDIFSGQPAITHIKTAFSRGKHVITANKGPVAWTFRELKKMAEEQNALFFYETTVMDGTPVFNLARETLALCKVTEVEGILNTTTNFILEELANGKDYDSVIAEGKRRGFIEADPAMDIDGWDAAAKVAALLNVLMDAGITPMDIDRTGIGAVTEKQIREAREKNNVIKLICRGAFENGKVVASVKPVEVPITSLQATIDGTSSYVSITTDLMGKVSVIEHAPEIEQTGYGILSDLVSLMKYL